ncbi:hypothetical protein JVT61DRAFT_6295 [Boletus reticuloceps]|uniref:Hydrophobin n=1 Tax=Boletus reticuloceps TaxID=495285 RepID=A0A8I2YKP4_9AGAM|nr:hypothetical protein JVT61DRAFT_7475 [Boletus reticuloceps]KAG6373634.1 hypothetical protein JVT61DRAFT_6295 [Boletus reticuloceps]
MFVRVSTLILTIAASAIAGHMGGGTASTANQCNNGELQCCNVTKASQAPSSIINGLGLNPNTPIGLNCSPLSVLQLGGSQCSQQAVCCDDTRAVENQVVGIDCSPVNVNA